MSPPRWRRLLPVLLLALVGLSVGLGAARVLEREALSGGPESWRLHTPKIPVLLARLAGPPNLPGQGWSLASHGAWVAPGQRIHTLKVRAHIPENGRLEAVLDASGGQSGVGLWLDRGRTPFSGVYTMGPASSDASQPLEDRAPVPCDGELPAITEDNVAVEVHKEARVLKVSVAQGSGSPTTVTCRWERPTTGASVRSGLRRIGLQQLTVEAQGQGPAVWTAPGVDGTTRGLAALVGVLAFGGLGAGLRAAGARGAELVVPTLPLLAVWPLSGSDVEAGLQAARLVFDDPIRAAVGGPLWLSAALAALVLCGRVARLREAPLPWMAGLGALVGLVAVPGYGAVGLGAVVLAAGVAAGLTWLSPRLDDPGIGPVPALVVGAAAGTGLTLVLQPRFGMAATYAGVAGMALGAVVWANVRRVRGYNVLSLVLMGAVVFVADQGLRWTQTGARVTGRSARARPGAEDDAKTALAGAFSSFEALEVTKSWSEYPRQDYPVAPPARRADAVRLVAMGGSSTGGAWQNDDLDEFWPAELERQRGPSVQAVNLGVGGWTTLHIRRFIETRLDDVDPDVVVVYVGHNDMVTESARPYSELLAAWRSGSDASVAVSGALARVPLYQLLRFSLQAVAGRQLGAAVPVADARANLTAVADRLEARGTPLLLAREGVAPDPSVLDDYAAMMRTLAQSRPRVAYVDTAAALTGPGAGDVFLDNCHLTERGHARVAAAIDGALSEAGWLPAR